MATQFSDALEAFEDDLVTKTTIPIENENVPTDSASLRVFINNPAPESLFLNSPAREMKAEFNVEINAPLGTNKYAMMYYARPILDTYLRGYTLTAGGRRVVITQSRQSSPYPTDAHQRISVIIEFVFFA